MRETMKTDDFLDEVLRVAETLRIARDGVMARVTEVEECILALSTADDFPAAGKRCGIEGVVCDQYAPEGDAFAGFECDSEAETFEAVAWVARYLPTTLMRVRMPSDDIAAVSAARDAERASWDDDDMDAEEFSAHDEHEKKCGHVYLCEPYTVMSYGG